jgi:hypothetical protein
MMAEISDKELERLRQIEKAAFVINRVVVGGFRVADQLSGKEAMVYDNLMEALKPVSSRPTAQELETLFFDGTISPAASLCDVAARALNAAIEESRETSGVSLLVIANEHIAGYNAEAKG